MVSINIDLPEELRADAIRMADAQGVTLEEFLRRCIAERLKGGAAEPAAANEQLDADEAHVEYMRKGLAEAEEAITRGEVSDWDPDAFLDEMHRRHQKS
ncbi:hypothetical protein MalM25_36950 [Planctomycetes bacterium MalM25]|nr:hypothetical protein MalM25_36950 [Planctomycetes bacterium MalM25]